MTTILVSLLVGFALTQIANVATTLYLHRSLTHRAVTFSTPLNTTFRAVIWLLTGIRPRQWAAVHRKHHAWTDQDADPHSPLRLGWVRVQLTNVSLYRRVARDPSQVAKYARDIPRTKLDRVLLDHAMLGLGITTAFLILALGVTGGIVAAVFHLVVYLMLSGAVNAIAHTFGDRPYENSATNLQWLAMLTSGEGLHNNHHAAPTSAKFSLDKGQIDPGWWFIRAARTVGQATVRHDMPILVTPRRVSSS